MKVEDIKDIDICYSFFHYTNKSNIESIAEKDFSYKDIDEVKAQKFNRKLLKMVYAKQHKMSSKKMDYWNMHTFSNITIPPNKITLIKLNNSYKCLDILLWMIENNNIDIKILAPFLYEFLQYYNLL